MIKFFRKIRQQLLGEGKTGKYFKYAIGEILLVMIGILLALQVNNWNEERKDRDEVRKYLNSFLSDLTVDSLNYDRMSKYMDDVIEVNNTILNKFKENKPIDEKDFKAAFRTFTIPPIKGQNSTFNEMQSSGKISLIEDNTLKKKILQYYVDYDFKRKVEALNNSIITSQPISNKIDINSFIHLNINQIEEVDELNFDFFNRDRENEEFEEYVNSTSLRSLMSIANRSVYRSGVKQATELKKEILEFLETY